FQEFDKAYRAEMILGITTNTQDGEGDILRQTPVSLHLDKLQSALNAFAGEYDQLPPMFSAVKVNGKRLYELARRGEEIERKTRKVTITHLNLLSAQLEREHPVVRFDVTCSKGTYIRTLCADIGEALGCGAYMSFLVRTRVGPFFIENAHTLEKIKSCMEEGTLASLLLPADTVFSGYPAIYPDERQLVRFINGAEINAEGIPVAGEIVRVYENQGSFIGLGKLIIANDQKMIRAYRLFM
ncbi:MAG: tRNA pseudouridine(55) synthase TruB, partial [Thermoclostridium sp.]|nr:tRNA pseudouridine(55) synthase TruB [Thermoclostridium sp.]